MITSLFNFENIFADLETKIALEQEVFPAYINTCRWFAGKAREVRQLTIENQLDFKPNSNLLAYILILKIEYTEGESENYFLPISFINSFELSENEIHPKGIIADASFNNIIGQLVDATYDTRFQQAVFQCISNNTYLNNGDQSLIFKKGKGLLSNDTLNAISSKVLLVEQSNSSIIYGEKYFLKLYRKLFTEANPEVEMVEFLTENSDYKNIPSFAGSISWVDKNKQLTTLGMMQQMIDNQADTWVATNKSLNSFINAFVKKEFLIDENIFETVELLAQRTAEMHLGLYSPLSISTFSPQKFDETYRIFLHNRIQKLLENRYNLIIDCYQKLEGEAQKLAWDFMEAKELIDEFIEEILNKKLYSLRTRIHGDYHLGQILETASDFIIIDFEGEPESSIVDRKIKHSPLKDVAGIIRSYHYAISAKFFNDEAVANSDKKRIAKASERWYGLIQKTFLEKYFSTFGKPHPLFKNNNEINFLLLVYLLEKAVYELGYEVNYRPDWIKIPLKGIVDVIREIEKLKM